MIDAFQQLEDQITEAIPQPQATPRTSPFRRRRRSRLAAVSLAAALGLSAVAVAVAATQLVGHGHTVKPRSVGVDARPHFAVFRRPARPDDRPLTRSGKPDATLAGDTRLILSDHGTRLYASNAGDGRICVLLQTGSLAARTCTATDQAIAADLPPSITMLTKRGSTYGSQTYLLMVDGVRSVDATTTSGRTVSVSVRGNAVTLPRNTQRAAWQTPDHRHHALDRLVPASPTAASPRHG